MRGSVESGAFTAAYLSGGRVVALDCINTPADFAQGKMLVERGAEVDSCLLADASRPLKVLVSQRAIA